MNKLQAQTRLKELSEQILDKGDNLTGAEAKAALVEWDQCEAAIKVHKQALRWTTGNAALPGEDGMPPAGAGDLGWSTGAGIDSGKRLVFGTKSAAGLATKMLGYGDGHRHGDGQLGAKALAPSGTAVVAQEFRPDPIALGQPAHGFAGRFASVSHEVRPNSVTCVKRRARITLRSCRNSPPNPHRSTA